MRARFVDIRIEALDELIDRTRSKLEGSRASMVSDMPGGGGHGDWTNMICKLEEYEAERERLDGIYREVKDAIERLEDERYRTALMLYYIMGKSWRMIADRMGYDERTVQRWHGRALQELKKFLPMS